MQTRVVVVGQGYVGLPLATAAARAGHSVTGIDLDKQRVEALNEGSSPVGDVSDADLREALDSGRYTAAASFDAVSDAEIVVLCVPTPYHNEAPDLSYVISAGEEVGRFLKADTLVILESTTYPGTTDEILAPVLERASGMTVGAEHGIDLAFSPERIDPGNPTYGLHNTPKVVGGCSPRATERATAFYGAFVEQVVPVSGPKAAEMAKLLENTFRHINIALVNELAVLCQDLDVDVWEVIDAAASKPFGYMPFYPGPGVGGHCIPVDPMYLSWRVRQFGGAAKFIELARDVNSAMPYYCVTRLQDLLNERSRSLKDAKVLVLGIAYKQDIADLRESPSLPFLTRLAAKGVQLAYHDSYVPSLQVPDGPALTSLELTDELLAEQDCVVIFTPHKDIDLDRVVRLAPLVFDTRGVVPAGASVHRL